MAIRTYTLQVMKEIRAAMQGRLKCVVMKRECYKGSNDRAMQSRVAISCDGRPAILANEMRERDELARYAPIRWFGIWAIEVLRTAYVNGSRSGFTDMHVINN